MNQQNTTDPRPAVLGRSSNGIYKVGLTGGIASGKSSVTENFQRLGVPVVDADIIAREVVAAGSQALSALQGLFPETILNNSQELDRKKLRSIIFKDPDMRGKVEAILHPAIRALSAERVQQHADSGADYVICAVPLLVETGQVTHYDRIAVVDVPIEVQITRVIARDNTTRENAIKIIQSQASREERQAVADDIIDNTGTLQTLAVRVSELHEQYLQLAQRKRV